jgi:Cu-Zn family superoxide dismutase
MAGPIPLRFPGLVAAATLALLAGCAGMSMGSPGLQARLEARSGSQVAGTVHFSRQGERVLVEARINGLTPGRQHGFHVHEAGDCSAADASSAKGHFNPAAQPHGDPVDHAGHAGHGSAGRHAGDLPNLVADASGQAVYRAEVQGLTLDAGATGILGRAVVVHADPDDYRSQPAGNSGRRVACGVITAG